MIIKIGFTGSRRGMTSEQHEAFVFFTRELGVVEFHHGMCRGADTEAHDVIAMRVGACIVGHPPISKGHYVWRRCFRVHEPKSYLDRNKDIVDATEELVACPSGPEVLRSGTWSTIRYARRQGKRVTIITPDGIITQEDNDAKLNKNTKARYDSDVS